jgi:hypothetical protein
MWIDQAQRVLLLFSLILSALLLIRFAVDFSAEGWWLAALFWLMVLAALGLSASNLFTKAQPAIAAEDKRARSYWQVLLLQAIPLAFLACALDCAGLSLIGCTPFCTLIKLLWIPLIWLGCVVYHFTQRRGVLLAITAMSFLPLVPHCCCYNVANVWWVERIGASPECYAWGSTVSLIAISSLRARPGDLDKCYTLPSLAICGAIIFGASAFFVAHHYFHYPW